MMIKVLIVDDEEIERRSMHVILSDAFQDIEVREARNGRLAIEIASTFKPDLILMDIKMPGIDGLEAIEQIKKELKTTKFIMVTAYDTFTYAKQAIKLGVNDYILKPSKTTEISTIVGQAIEQIKQEKVINANQLKKNIHFEKSKRIIETDIVTQLLFDHVHEVHIDMVMEMLEIKPAEQVFVLVVLLPEGLESQYPALISRIKQVGDVWIGALYGRQFPVIVFRDLEQSFRSQAIKVVQHAFKKRNQAIEQGWLIGIGDVYHSLDHVQKSYQEALIAMIDMERTNHYRFYQDLPIGENDCDRQLDKYRNQQFFDQVRLGEWDNISQKLTTLIQCYEKDQAPLETTQQKILEFVWMIARLLDEMNIHLDWKSLKVYSETYQQFIEEIRISLNQLKEKYQTYQQNLESDAIKQIKQYIIDHSSEEISLDVLADRVGLSTIYISKMFKEKWGINYIDFLTECRIEKAKELIRNPEKSIKEIAYDVGYHDPNYFSKVFKKTTGSSPMAYRERVLINR